MDTLDAQLLAAHAARDTAALVDLYRRAAQEAGDMQAQAFYLTHAHVFALELGHPQTDALRAELIALGRETPLAAPIAPFR